MRIGRKQQLPGEEWGATPQHAAKKLVCCIYADKRARRRSTVVVYILYTAVYRIR